jgi:sec-independent protein translocase protein TatB
MFDIGFWEMLVIGVMALVILGPERLPSAIRSTMNTIRSVKDMANGFKQEVASQLDAHELHANLKKAESLGMKNLGKDLQDSVNELKAAAASVQQPYKKKGPNESSSENSISNGHKSTGNDE